MFNFIDNYNKIVYYLFSNEDIKHMPQKDTR